MDITAPVIQIQIQLPEGPSVLRIFITAGVGMIYLVSSEDEARLNFQPVTP